MFKYAHVIAFVYWLGGDLGTFFGSKYVAKPELSPQTRAIALKIMLACDQGPKIAMPLIFPFGLQMASQLGVVNISASLLIAIWLIAAVWVVNVRYMYTTDNQAAKAKVGQFDWWLRVVVIAAIVIYAVMGLLDNSLISAPWLAYKMLIFAALVFFGMMIRKNLVPFIVEFGKMMRNGASDEGNAVIEAALHRVHPWVYGIWFGLFLNAAIGMHLLG
ncbi:MAG TPA: hypothetical protein ENI05_14695 [Porticoccus sp.]|nr:hypothetical protein [Porticoccus sp.]